jgi:hypothetical protein
MRSFWRVVLVVAGCQHTHGADQADARANGADAGPSVTALDVPAQATKNLDVLFVVDDSASMTDNQQTLLLSFPAFADVLANAGAGCRTSTSA